jgi:NAD(P)-dependent dehydrogenase (short-subunit alcohol dehydrogenase family)
MLASRNPAKIYITGRNELSAQQVIADIKSSGSNTEMTFIRCDHADLASVKKAPNEISKEPRLDILMANAGVMALPPGE